MQASINAAALPIGWSDGTTHGFWDKLLDGLSLMTLLGWVLTALAASLGAAFWFDTLKRFISIRSSGEKPEGDMTASGRSDERPCARLPTRSAIQTRRRP